MSPSRKHHPQFQEELFNFTARVCASTDGWEADNITAFFLCSVTEKKFLLPVTLSRKATYLTVNTGYTLTHEMTYFILNILIILLALWTTLSLTQCLVVLEGTEGCSLKETSKINGYKSIEIYFLTYKKYLQDLHRWTQNSFHDCFMWL